MSSYCIELREGNLLEVGFNAKEPANNDVIVKDAIARLQELIDNQSLRGGALLKINGSQSLPVAYTIAHRVAHLYGAIAVYDPKLADTGLPYVVSIAHGSQYAVGECVA
jgi:CRISPR-associated protein Csx3